jgi:hypothetical protein
VRLSDARPRCNLPRPAAARLAAALLLVVAGACARSEHPTLKRAVDMTDMPWGPTVDGWRLSLSLDKPQFARGEKIVAAVVFQNTAAAPRGIGGSGVDFDYDIECRDQQGLPIPLTLFGRRMLENRGEGKATGGTLGPGEQVVAELALSLHLDLTLPGRYTVSVSRRPDTRNPGRAPVVKSNVASFQID